MSVYLYDGSFEGFLSVVYQSFYEKKPASKIVKSLKDISLLDEVVEIVTDNIHAQKVHQALQSRFEKRNYNKIFHTFLCDSKDFEKALYDFIVIGFKNQNKLADINHPSIYYLEKLEREYFRHLDKMYGFIRFEELEDGSLYAKIEGKFNILPYLGKHFVKRLDGYDFIIHDTVRALAYVKTKEGGMIHQVADFEAPKLSKDEAKFQKLWKLFFGHVTIKERKNLKLQKNWIPLLYRTYMTEFI
jgi:probable DNA metabolism protein